MPKYVMLKNDVGKVLSTNSKREKGKYEVATKFGQDTQYHNGIHEISEQEYNDYKLPAKRSKKS